MTDLSSTSTITDSHDGDVSARLIDIVDALLDGDQDTARALFAATIEMATPASVAHRLDVVGRNLMIEVADAQPSDVASHRVLQTLDLRVDPADVVEDWRRGASGTADIDLIDGRVDVRGQADRLWSAMVTVAWAIDRAGFPPQVIV